MRCSRPTGSVCSDGRGGPPRSRTSRPAVASRGGSVSCRPWRWPSRSPCPGRAPTTGPHAVVTAGSTVRVTSSSTSTTRCSRGWPSATTNEARAPLSTGARGRTDHVTATSPESTAASTPESKPFHDLEEYVALPRVSGLTLSTDGRRLVTAVATLDAKRTAYVTALWEVDPSGERPARRLTRSAKGESSAAFTPSGDLLFTSARPDPEPREGADDEPARALWLLPADGAEARVVADRAAGFAGVRVATGAGVVLLGSDVLPRALDDADDERLRKARKDKKVGAILHTGYPVRYWDHDLGPAEPHLFAATVRADLIATRAGDPDPRLELRDITPLVGRE